MQTQTLKVTGMTCGGCTNSVTRALKAVPGVADVNVQLQGGEAKVQYDEALTSLAQMEAAVEGAGFGVGSSGRAEAHASKGCCH